MKPTRNPFIHALGLSLAACLTANAITWDGESKSTNNWIGGSGANSGERNWDTNNAPVASNPLIFAGTTRLAPNNNTAAGTSYAGITFNNTAGAFVLAGNGITLGGDVINDDADLQTINMAMSLSATRTFNAASGNITVGGVISGSGFGIIKTGSNTLSLNASNTYTGATTIKAGTLELLAGASLASPSLIVGDTGSTGAILDAITSGLIVANGQTVSGIGTIKGSTTIQLGGTLAPGNSAGILTNLGNVSLQAGSNFQMEINGATAGTGYDQLNVTGPTSTVTLAGLLSVTTGSTPTNGSLFFLIDNDGPSAISGTFSNAPINGNTYTFGSQQYAVSYFGDYGTTSFTGGNDVVLMAVPEPGAALIGGLGVLFLLRRRRGTTV
jgi:autotransporter-associated beta strand protein